MSSALLIIRKNLQKHIDLQYKQGANKFFKEEVKHLGIRSKNVKKVAAEVFKSIKNLPKRDIFNLCERLWEKQTMEECMIAINWSFRIRKQFDKTDFKRFEIWIDKYVNNWATCDVLCTKSIGDLVKKNPELIKRLITWTRSKNRWLRRASAVSLIVPIRHGKFLKNIFEIADILLLDQDDLVQKGYGWMLKAASQTYQKEVFDYVVKNKKVMPRTALRYAIEKMPLKMKRQAMI